MLLETQQQQPDELLGKVAQGLGMVTEDQVVQALPVQLNLKTFTIGNTFIPPEVLQHINETMAEMYRVVPIRFDEDMLRLTVVTCDPQGIRMQDELRTLLGFDMEMVISTQTDVIQAIERIYFGDVQEDDAWLDYGATEKGGSDQSIPPSVSDLDLDSQAGEEPLTGIVDRIMSGATNFYVSKSISSLTLCVKQLRIDYNPSGFGPGQIAFGVLSEEPSDWAEPISADEFRRQLLEVLQQQEILLSSRGGSGVPELLSSDGYDAEHADTQRSDRQTRRLDSRPMQNLDAVWIAG